MTASDPVSLSSVSERAWRNVETGSATLGTGDDLGAILADAEQLQSALESLFRNAVEHGSTSPRSEPHEDAVEHGGRDAEVRVGRSDGGFYVEDAPDADA